MDEGKQIDLQPGEFRQAFNGPLANPRVLRFCVALYLAASVAGVCVSIWVREIWLLAFFPIPIAMLAGASLAGLWPNFFFGNGSKDDPIA